ncbi:hypothetical protein Hanom_Chr02g00135021 [Helianthus anomalus]
MSTSTKLGSSKKGRKSKPKDPIGPDRAAINRKEEEFHQLYQYFKFPADWSAQFSTAGNTALNAPPGYRTVYAAFFEEGDFLFPMTMFFSEVLS